MAFFTPTPSRSAPFRKRQVRLADESRNIFLPRFDVHQLIRKELSFSSTSGHRKRTVLPILMNGSRFCRIHASTVRLLMRSCIASSRLFRSPSLAPSTVSLRFDLFTRVISALLHVSAFREIKATNSRNASWRFSTESPNHVSVPEFLSDRETPFADRSDSVSCFSFR